MDIKWNIKKKGWQIDCAYLWSRCYVILIGQSKAHWNALCLELDDQSHPLADFFPLTSHKRDLKHLYQEISTLIKTFDTTKATELHTIFAVVF